MVPNFDFLTEIGNRSFNFDAHFIFFNVIAPKRLMIGAQLKGDGMSQMYFIHECWVNHKLPLKKYDLIHV